MNREEAEEKTCPFKHSMVVDTTGDILREDGLCDPENCMMWEDDKKCGNTTYIGGCRLKLKRI